MVDDGGRVVEDLLLGRSSPMRMQRSVSSQPTGRVPTRPSSWLNPPTSLEGLPPEGHVGADQVAHGLERRSACPSGCSRRPSRTPPGTSPGLPSSQRGRTVPPTPTHAGVGVGVGEPLEPVGRGHRVVVEEGDDLPCARAPRRCCGRPRGPAAPRWRSTSTPASAAAPRPAAPGRGRSRGRSPAAGRLCARIEASASSSALESILR